MLGLTLREEFRGKRLKGTAIDLSNDSNTGATQIAAQEFLEITYPTHDLLKGIEAVGPNQGRPVVVIGERGLGKSHLMAALYHAVNDTVSTAAWLNSWSNTLKDPNLAKIGLRSGMTVIGESLHRQRYKFLWDLLLERHPHGTYIKGKWEGMGAAKTDIPSDQLILELLQHTPTMLLLDEFQTWFDTLTNTKQYPWKNWAFNFIQILSEIAKEHPELLVLVISVRNGGSDAYQQVHRVNPVAIDFMAGGDPQRVQQDRRRMLLHRLFTNRLDFARDWSGKHKRRLTSDLDQALVLIGACFDGSGINASDTLKNENFKPHVALKPLLEWLHKNGPDQASRNAASRAVSIYNGWAATQGVKPTQSTLFEEY